MKKFTFLAVALVMFSGLGAQTGSKVSHFRFDLGFGTAMLKSGNASTPFLLSGEPSWKFGSYKIGLRFERTAKMYMKDETSELLTVDRYFGGPQKEFRIFAGGGIGLYHVTKSGGCDGGPTATQTTHSTKPLGGMIRAGFEVHKFRLSVEYNAVQQTYVRDYDPGKVLMGTRIYSSSYFGFKAGVIIGKK